MIILKLKLFVLCQFVILNLPIFEVRYINYQSVSIFPLGQYIRCSKNSQKLRPVCDGLYSTPAVFNDCGGSQSPSLG